MPDQLLEELLAQVARILNAVKANKQLNVPSHMPVALPQVAFQQLKAKLIAYELSRKKVINDHVEHV